MSDIFSDLYELQVYITSPNLVVIVSVNQYLIGLWICDIQLCLNEHNFKEIMDWHDYFGKNLDDMNKQNS